MEKYLGIEKLLSKDKIKYNEPMKNHTTIKIGGNVDCLVIPTTIDEIVAVIKYAKENNIRYYVIGNGSDLLVCDEPLHALIIKIASRFDSISVDGETITSYSGVSMPKLSQVAKQNNLSGLEFACGIPGTVGGGIKMNAGAYGSDMSFVADEIIFLDDNCNLVTISNEEANFSYRHSIFTENPNYVILSAKFKLKKGDPEEISKMMKENSLARRTKQPLEYPNAGSTFRRPEGHFVGKLVQDAGLKGYTIGGAQVSEKHTGFIVNIDNATCKDVKELIKHIQDTVYEKFNVELHTEIEIIGGEE